jgi:hypothetical protein
MVVYEVGPLGRTDQIVIAGLDAVERARVVFRPGGLLSAEIAPHLAYVVKGTVYFMDGEGTVSSMGVDGRQTVVTKFPIQFADQAASFSVSPDGCQLAASVLTPARNGTPWTLQTMKASAGGPAQRLHTWTSNPANPPNSKSPGAFRNLVLVGWDSLGPIAIAGSDVGYSSPTAASDALWPRADYTAWDFVANLDFIGGQVVHLAGDGTAGAAAAPPTCNAAQVSPGGDITCFQAGSKDAWTLSVLHSVGGTVVGAMSIPVGMVHSGAGGLPCWAGFHFNQYQTQCPGTYVALGPNGLVAATWAVSASTGVPAKTKGLWQGPDGSGGSLPAFFYPEKWIDAHTIFGQHTTGLYDAALVRIGGAQPSLEDLQFTGNLVGMLSA